MHCINIDLLPVCDQTVHVESEKQDRIHEVTSILT